MQSVVTIMQDDAVTGAVAGKALNVSAVVVSNLTEATRSGQTSDIVSATVELYSGVTRYLNSPDDGGDSTPQKSETEQTETLKQNLKSRAGSFCDALTDNSVPDAAPFGANSDDFFFSCQKVQTRARANTSQDEAVVAALPVTTKAGKTYTAMPLNIKTENRGLGHDL